MDLNSLNSAAIMAALVTAGGVLGKTKLIKLCG